MAATPKTVDMSQVKEKGAFSTKHLPEGDYPAKVTKCEDHTSKTGNDNWLYTIVIASGPGKGASYPYYCGQDPDQLWKVRNLFVAAGKNVPKKKLKLDPNAVVGRAVGVTLEDDEYNGKPKSSISGFLPIGEVGDAPAGDADDDDVEVDEAPAAAKEGKKSKKDKGAKGKKEKGKKGKTEVTDDELEELEVEDLS